MSIQPASANPHFSLERLGSGSLDLESVVTRLFQQVVAQQGQIRELTARFQLRELELSRVLLQVTQRQEATQATLELQEAEITTLQGNCVSLVDQVETQQATIRHLEGRGLEQSVEIEGYRGREEVQRANVEDMNQRIFSLLGRISEQEVVSQLREENLIELRRQVQQAQLQTHLSVLQQAEREDVERRRSRSLIRGFFEGLRAGSDSEFLQTGEKRLEHRRAIVSLCAELGQVVPHLPPITLEEIAYEKSLTP